MFLIGLVLLFALADAGPVVNKNVDRRDITCPSITVQYSGTFKNSRTPEIPIDARFQIKLTSDIVIQRIQLEGQHWDESLSNSSVFRFWFNDENDGKWIHVFNHTDTIVLTKSPSIFTINLDRISGLGLDQSFNIFYQEKFNLLFTLQQAVGQCTDYIPTYPGSNIDPNPSFYHVCACCGDYNPDSFLVCPSPWSHTIEENQQKSAQLALPAPFKTAPDSHTQVTTTAVPQRQDIRCLSVTTHHTGTFKHIDNAAKINAEFQFKLNVDHYKNRIYFTGQHWNSNISNHANFNFYLNDGTHGDRYECQTLGQGCSFPIDLATPIVYVDIRDNPHTQSYPLLFTNEFDSTTGFKLKNAIGQCTNEVTPWDLNDVQINFDLYRFCVCCGDEYYPHPALDCPINPWN